MLMLKVAQSSKLSGVRFLSSWEIFRSSSKMANFSSNKQCLRLPIQAAPYSSGWIWQPCPSWLRMGTWEAIWRRHTSSSLLTRNSPIRSWLETYSLFLKLMSKFQNRESSIMSQLGQMQDREKVIQFEKSYRRLKETVDNRTQLGENYEAVGIKTLIGKLTVFFIRSSSFKNHELCQKSRKYEKYFFFRCTVSRKTSRPRSTPWRLCSTQTETSRTRKSLRRWTTSSRWFGRRSGRRNNRVGIESYGDIEEWWLQERNSSHTQSRSANLTNGWM